MFFYTALLVASVILAFVFVYLYSVIVGSDRSVFRALLSRSKKHSTSGDPDEEHATTINETLTPWGWDNQSSPAKPVNRNPALSSMQTPWGWKGNNDKTHEKTPGGVSGNNPATGRDAFAGNSDSGSSASDDRNPTVGWPYREEKFEFAGKAYKVKRKVIPAKTNLRDTGKPWGW